MKNFNQFCKQCREWRYSSLVLFVILSMTVLFECLFFHWQFFHSILISSIIKNPETALLFYIPKILISVTLSSFVFIFKDKRWSIIIPLVVTIWIIAELMYSRANHLSIDVYTMTMVNNMDGFWSSLFLLIEKEDLAYVIILMLYGLMSYILNDNKIQLKHYIVTFLLCIILNIAESLIRWYKIDNEHTKFLQKLMNESGDEIFPPGANGQKVNLFLHPFSFDMVSQIYGDYDKYLHDYSAIHAFIYNIKELFYLSNDISYLDNINTSILNVPLKTYSTPDGKLLICLIESLETWVISQDITPNLYNLTNMDNTLYCSRITSQARRGTSADGQMIVVTGLLPIRGGAVCFRYPHNTFPSVFELYKSKPNCAFFPHVLSVWNQSEMSKSYGIDTSYVVPEYDNVLFRTVCDSAALYFNELFITSSTHSPFNKISDSSSLSVLEDMPIFMKSYIRSFNYMDKSVGILIDHIKNDPAFSDYTIVITGDHTIFQDEKREDFYKFCREKNLNLPVQEPYCPLIIYSPKICSNKKIDDICYQMDIYPTILHLIGCEDYYWKGFGVNLLDEEARKNRPITEEEAFELSDKIIRANYFQTYLDSIK